MPFPHYRCNGRVRQKGASVKRALNGDFVRLPGKSPFTEQQTSYTRMEGLRIALFAD